MELKTVKTKKRFNKKIVFIIASLIVVGGIIGAKYVSNKKTSDVFVTVKKATKADLSQTMSLTGSIEAKDKQEIMLNPAQKVIEVVAKEGQKVKTGDIIAKLDVTDLNSQLVKAQSLLKSAKITLNTLSSGKDKASLQDNLKLAQLGMDDLKSKLDEAKVKVDQNKQMLDKGFISKSEYDISLKVVKDLQNQITTSEIKLSESAKSIEDYDSNNADKIEMQKISVDSAASDIDSIKKKIDEAVIKANFDGVIAKSNLVAGQYPKTGDSVVIFSSGNYVLNVLVSQFDALTIAKGQKAEVSMKGVSKKFKAEVDLVSSYAEKIVAQNSSESKIKVRILLNENDDNIRVGFDADVDIILKDKKDTLVVTSEAIKKDSDGKEYVFTVKNGKVAKLPVKSGMAGDMNIEVSDGIKIDEEYIANPSDSLKEGTVVKTSGVSK